MLSYNQVTVAEFFATKCRAHKPASEGIQDLVGRKITDSRQLLRHCDRIASRLKRSLKEITCAELAAAFSAGGANRQETAPVDLATRVRASEARKIAGGGRRMPGGVLPPDAAAKLDQLLAANYAGSALGVIARALLDVKL